MNMVIKQRATLLEAIMAFILLVVNYQKKGYLSRSLTAKNLRMLCSRFYDYIAKVRMFNHNPSQGQVIVAKRNGLIVGTVCLEFNPNTTPIEDIFPDELAELRHSTQSFVYIGSFAIASSYQCTRLSLRMLRELWNMVEKKGIDVGICVVHPDHSMFYKRFGFVQIASSKNTTGLDSAPAALLVIKRQDVRL